MDILIAAVLGAIGGMVGGLIGHWVTRNRPNKKMASIITTACIVVTLTATRQSGLIKAIHEWISPKTRVEKIFDDAVRTTFESNPNALARLKNAKDPEKEAELLTAAGVKRLNDDSQLERAKLLFDIAAASSEATCAGLFTGNLNGKLFFADLERLPDATLQAYAGISKSAAELELKNAPYDVIGENEVGQIFQAYIQKIGGADGEQLQNVLVKPPPNTPENNAAYCRATKTFFGNIEKLDKPEAAKLLRFIAASAAAAKN